MSVHTPLPRRTRLLPVLLACLVGAPGCDSAPDVVGPGPDAPVATTLRLGVTAAVTLKVPASQSLQASVLDQFGHVLPGQTIEYVTRDSTTVSVDATGTATAVAAGETVVVARSGAVSDSVFVAARYHVLPGEARARIRGSRFDHERSWDPDGLFVDYVSSDDRDYTLLQFFNSAYADTGLVAWFTEAPQAGSYALGPTDVMAVFEAETVSELGGPGGFFLMESGDDLQLSVGIEGRLDLESVTPATEMGGEGTVEGRLYLKAVEYLVTLDDDWKIRAVETGDTFTVYADFSGGYSHYPRGEASFTLTGADTLTVERAAAYWYSYGAGGALDAYGGGAAVELRLDEPAEGLFAIVPDPPGWYSGTAPSISTFTDSAYGHGTGGTVTLDRVLLPTETTYGELRGSVQAGLDFYDAYYQGTAVGSGTVTMSFHVPMEPLGAWASAVRRERDDVPLWRSLVSNHREAIGSGERR